MKLSVIVPCYNELKTIREIIIKVNSIEVKNMEIIIVDDASTDGTREILDNEIKQHVSKMMDS